MRLHFFNSAVIANSKMDYSCRYKRFKTGKIFTTLRLTNVSIHFMIIVRRFYKVDCINRKRLISWDREYCILLEVTEMGSIIYRFSQG